MKSTAPEVGAFSARRGGPAKEEMRKIKGTKAIPTRDRIATENLIVAKTILSSKFYKIQPGFVPWLGQSVGGPPVRVWLLAGVVGWQEWQPQWTAGGLTV